MSLDIEPGTIIVGVDGSADADRALRWAAGQASLERRPLALVSFASIDPLSGVSSAAAAGYVVPAADLLEGAHGVAELAADAVRQDNPGLSITAHAALGDAREVLVDLSRQAHLVVLGSRGRGVLRSRLLGSVSAAVIRRAHCPVVVCRPESPGKVRRGVLVGADGSADDRLVLETAFQQASMRGLPLTVLHSFRDVVAAVHEPHLVDAGESLEDERLLVAEAVAGFSEKYPEVPVDVRLARGLPQDCLVADSERWHLIVVGRHPTESLGRKLSPTVATAVVERARTTVAVVPVPGPQ